MKKFIILLIFITGIFCLNAAQLTRFYHKNYGIIDRSVFVFDKNPGYLLEESVNQIKISVTNCSMAETIKDLPLENNPVLSSYSFSSQRENVIITLNLNRSADETRKGKVEEFLLTEGEYKLVLDVFKYSEPKSAAEINTFIEFYEKVELNKKAVVYRNLLAEWTGPEINKPEEIASAPEEETAAREEELPLSNPVKNTDNFFKNKLPGPYIILSVILILVVVILIFIISNLRKKSKSKDLFHSKEKLGSQAFRVKVIRILREADWEENMIAEELGISLDELKNIPK